MTLSVDIKYKSNGQIASLKGKSFCLFRLLFTPSLAYVALFSPSALYARLLAVFLVVCP